VRRAVWLVAIVALLPAQGRSTTLVSADFTELVRAARVIAHGRVIDMTARFAGRNRRVETLLTIHADAYFKGDLGHRISVRTPGGELGGFRTILVGAPHFAAGDEVVLFLTWSHEEAVPHIVGLSQGVFRVLRRTSGEAIVATPAVVGAAGRVRRGDGARGALPLGAFTSQVRLALAAGVAQAR
jgi:hypothetical protein